MKAPQFDPGLTQKFDRPIRRIINKDGTFNVHRRGTTWRDVHPYLWLIDMPWYEFLAVLLTGYMAVNLAFAAIYDGLGPDALITATKTVGLQHFLTCFFFSAQTLTTVGYGTVAPNGFAANLVSTLEAGLGLMFLSVGTGILFGRISKPSARIGFSPHIVVAPYQEGMSLQFRVVNKRRNTLMNLEATLLLMTVDQTKDGSKRNYTPLTLERPSVYFFPLTWTVVHPIDEQSPIRNMTREDMRQLQAEFLVVIKGFDETFSQTVHSRYSYRYDEVVWNARFRPAFHINEEGDLVLEVDEVGALADSDSRPRIV